MNTKKGLQYFWAMMFLALLSVSGQVLAQKAEAPRILIYGDSITWGFVPAPAPPVRRYPFSARWAGVLQHELGASYIVVEEGLNGRTAGVDEFSSALDASIRDDFNLNGRPGFLPILRTHEPLALVVILLGTNDTRHYHKQSLADIQASIAHLIKIAKLGARLQAPKILLIAPPPGQPGQNKGFNDIFAGSYARAAQLGKAYQEVATAEGVEFFDAASVIPVVDTADGIHLDEAGNQKLGRAVASRILKILP
jgi:lysophospholipase L1-like esterase